MHSGKSRYVAVGLVALTLVASGCSSVVGSSNTALPTATNASPLPTTGPVAATPTATAEVPHDSEQPSASPEVGAEATTIATSVVTAFCRPALDRQTWINGLYPFLSQTAAVAYGTVNPGRVPCTTLTGDARLRDTDGSYTTRVFVPTDAGEYSVLLNRSDVSDPWLVEQITPYTGG